MTVGIICEYNPFHNGHLYHINKIKELYPNCTIILVMSGNFTQRGELSIINKWDKTDIALYYGIDLVVELPFKYASSSADIFAYGAINLLKQLHVDYLVFGSESNDVSLLTEIAKTQINNPKYDLLVKEYLNNGYNYPTAMNKALKKLHNKSINTPNDLLAISYIKEIIKQKSNIKPISIQRTNDYHSTKLEQISSATSIRLALKEKKDIKFYVPEYCYKFIKKPLFIDDYFLLLKYKIISSNDLSIYQDVDEGIENRIKKYIYECHNLEELIKKVKTKRYTYNRLKRMFIHILVGYTKLDNLKDYNYIRVLGLNNKGKKHLKKFKKEINIPIITNYSKSKGLIDTDYEINSILCLNFTKKEQEKYLLREKKEFIVR